MLKKLSIYFSTIIIVTLIILYLCIQPKPIEELLPFNKDITDIHVHVAGLGYGASGCFINMEMQNSPKINLYLHAMGVNRQDLQELGDEVLITKISNAIAATKVVKNVVLLALDGIITVDGQLDKEHTQVYVPNDYVLKVTKKHNNLLFGASINPYRPDAIVLLEKYASAGALLVKWIPSIMEIDPSDERLFDFYQKMIDLNIPLLTHTGMEQAFASANDNLSDPKLLKYPLDLGVKVVAAHIATTGTTGGESNFIRILPMLKKYKNLYADISSLTQINKLGFLRKALQDTEIHKKLIYGSDWPIQFFPLVSPYYHIDQISFAQLKGITTLDNEWDRDIALKRAMGVTEDIFYRGNDVLGLLP